MEIQPQIEQALMIEGIKPLAMSAMKRDAIQEGVENTGRETQGKTEETSNITKENK